MRKIIVFLLSIVLITMLITPVVAAGTTQITITPNKTTAYRGEEIRFTVSISGSNACTSVGVAFSFDTNVFELVEAEANASNATVNNVNLGQKLFAIRYKESTKPSGQIGYFVLKVKSVAAFAATTISGTVSVKNVDANVNSSVKAAKVTIACNHKYSNWAKWSATTHRRACSICGNAEVVAHAYANACDTTCDVCAAVRSVSDHVYSEEYTADETGHWFACINCGEKKDFVEHTPGEEAGEYTDQICTVCNFVITPALGHIHKYNEDEFHTDGEFHWQTCTGCGEDSEKIAHTYDGECHEACNAGCGYERRTLHNEPEKWETNERDHWKVCEDCQGEVNVGEHIWNQSVVTVQPTLQAAGEIVYKCAICQGEKAAVLPQLTLFQVIPWWGWIAAGFVSGAAVVTIITVIVISVKSKSNHKGRFSN